MITQRDKAFLPHVLVVPVGSKVAFRNDDPIFHNIFSLTKPNEFDTGLYKQGATYTETFKHPGAVQLLCNIHASMLGFVVVVDTPYYAQADAAGAFNDQGCAARRIPSCRSGTRARQVDRASGSRSARTASRVALRVGGDKRPPQFLPDKSGKPRQSHLGY